MRDGVSHADRLVVASGIRVGAAALLLAASVASVLLSAVGVLAFEERLGGRVTGWWGQPMPR
jgi:hypothetical protein